MVDGQRIHRVVGCQSDGTTRTQAEEYIQKTKSEAKERRLNLPEGRKLHLTFRTAADLYISMQEEGGGKNIVEKKWHLERHLKPFFGTMRIENISEFTLKKFRKKCLDSGMTMSTVNQLLSTYRHMGRRLTADGKIALVPAMIKLEKPDNARDYVLTADEKEALLDAASGDVNPYIWLFIALGLNTGLRHSEMLSAEFQNFDSERRRLKVRVKGGRMREQPLTKYITEVIAQIREMRGDEPVWLFPNAANMSGHYQSMRAPFKRIVLAAKLDPRKITPHVLRHTAITILAESGAAVQTIQEFSGHRSIDMVMRYVHPRDKAVDDALDVFEKQGTNSDRN